ncbi:MAG: hypothetical protein IJ760_00605 [Bacteroidales bacterium]|nr:hypothetical protein [Bacteroidales bacterium]
MKASKIIAMALLGVITVGANAQSLNVESAVGDLRKGSLKKAKAEIDAAAVHEKTKDDAKTWYYKALIYAEIGRDSQQKKPKFKDLAPDWADQAYEAALECKRLNTNNEGDFNKGLVSVFSMVGYDYYSRARNLFNEKKYVEAMETAGRAAEMYNNSGEGDNSSEAMFVAGLSAVANHDTANIKKYFNNLMRKRTDKEQVYNYLFNIYKTEGNMDQAMKVASNYQKATKGSYKAYLLLAEGYLLGENMEKGKEMINKALELTKDSTNIYPDLLTSAGSLLMMTGDIDEARTRFDESIKLKPVQFGANFGMGQMYYNSAVDKITSTPEPDPFNEESMALVEKLTAEANALFGQSTTYLEAAVNYIDNLPEGEEKAAQRANLGNALQALSTAYARLERYDEAKAARERFEKMAAEQ